MSSVDDVVLLGGDRMPALLERVEESLEDAGTEHGPELARLASETLSAGGKRLRPLLVLICGGASEDEALVRSSTAVELTPIPGTTWAVTASAAAVTSQ